MQLSGQLALEKDMEATANVANSTAEEIFMTRYVWLYQSSSSEEYKLAWGLGRDDVIVSKFVNETVLF